MKFAGYIRTIVLMLLFFWIVLSGRMELSWAENADKDSSIREETVTGEEMVWDEDLDEKLDKTIKILGAIKEELKDIKTSEKSATEAGEKETDRINALKDAFRKAVRIWRKVRKVAGPEAEQAGQAPITGEQEKKWSRDLSDKLDKGIEAMKAMKEELDRVEE